MVQQSRPTDFFTAGGTLSPDSPSYVKRPADDELFELALAGQFCYVLTTRQLGKSSLMVRTARQLQEHGASTAIIDLTKIGTGEITVDQWYLGLITRLKRELNLTADPDTWWAERASLGPVQRFTDFLRDVVLEETEGPVVIFIDEIESTLRLDFSDDFFAAIRAMYNARASDPELNRLTFVLLGAATPTDLIKDRTRTPFNIGQGIALEEFRRTDAWVLEQGVEAAHLGQGKTIFARIFHWTNGHPYLTQKLCLEVAKSEDGTWTDQRVDRLVERLFLSEEARKDTNLQFVRDNVRASPQRRKLLGLYCKVYEGQEIADDERSPEQNQLKLFGLVRAEQGLLRVRNEIYRRVFDLAWMRENTAVNWAPIVAGIAVFVALLAVGSILYNAWVRIQFQDCIANFYQADVPEERLAHFAGMFRLRGLFGPTDYDYQARELFYGLSREEQLALFNIYDVEASDLIVVIKGLYVTLADVDGTNSTGPLLEAMAIALDRPNGTPEAIDLKHEINSWLEGRELVRQKLHSQAIEAYNRAIALNGENPATLYERAKVQVELLEYHQALSDFNRVMAIARQAPAPTPTVSPTTMPAASYTLTPTSTSTPSVDITPTETPTPVSATRVSTPSPISTETPVPTATPTPAAFASRFATLSQMISAVRNVIYGNPGLVSALASAQESEYRNLREFGLVPTLTSTPELLPPPAVLEPENGARFVGGPVTFKWQWDRPLAQDENFSLRVYKEGELEVCHHASVHGLEYAGGLGPCSEGRLYWRVALVRELEEGQWQLASEPSTERWIYYIPEEEPWPPVIPESPYQYRIGRVDCTPNCGTTGIKGVVYDANNNPVPDLWVKVWSDEWCCGWDQTNIYEPFEILLGAGPGAGHWYVAIYDQDQSIQLSEVVEVYTDSEPCEPGSGGCQWPVVDFVATTIPTPTPPAALTGKIAFTLWNGASYDVWVANVDGSSRAMILREMRQPAFRPDGKIAVNGEAPDHTNLHVANADGSNLMEVSEHPEDSWPSWAPDGSRIVFDSNRHGDRRWRIYILDDVTKRTEGHVLRSAGGDTFGRHPCWLPDGRIVYRGCDYWAAGANCGLYIVPPDGSAIPMQLTTAGNDLAADGYGNEIVFMCDQRDGNWEIYKANNIGGGITRLTNNSAIDGLPTWSPDGKHIAFLSTRDGQWAMWAMNADGSNQRKLFDLPGPMGPDWPEERISWWVP